MKLKKNDSRFFRKVSKDLCKEKGPCLFSHLAAPALFVDRCRIHSRIGHWYVHALEQHVSLELLAVLVGLEERLVLEQAPPVFEARLQLRVHCRPIFTSSSLAALQGRD